MLLAAGAMLGAWADTHNKVQLWENGPYWAETNIGAEKPEEAGYYFWWGDTIGYKWENNAWVASDGSSSGFSFSYGNAPTYGTDAATLQSEGWITEDGVLAPDHDAAQSQWGGGWRMPTVQDLNDLCYNKCDWIWTTTNGVNGYLVRGKDEYSSASIFLPCTGYGSGNSRTAFSTHGYYWSSVPSSWNNAGGIVYLSDRNNIEYTSVRYAGSPIRPVQDAPAPANQWTSGDCTVTLDSEGTLTVSGPGAMANYDSEVENSPWYGKRNDVRKVIVQSDVTKIGDEAFSESTNLTSVAISEGVATIGRAAFYGCTSLAEIVFPDGVTTIEGYVFSSCSALTNVYCHMNAADLTWSYTQYDFPSGNSTKIHVKASQLAAYQEKFPTINATFVGDLPEFLSEDFERGVMPYGWTCESNDSNYLFSVGKGDSSDETGSHGGQYNAKLAHADWGVKSKLISPIVNLSDTTAPTLNFWFINRSWSGDNDELAVYYRTSSEAEWQLMTNFPSAHDSWTECAIALENPTATYQIAFECIYAYGYGIGIDDVSITDAGSLEESVTPDVTITEGAYFKATLAELGYDVPTDGQTAYSVKAYGLPAGLKLVGNKAVTKKDKKGKKVVVTPANVEWWIEGVPTAALDYATNPAYLVITVDGKTQTLPLSLGVEAQEVTELPDLALGEQLNEQFYLPGVTNGWTVSGLPTGLKYTPKLVTTTKKKGKKVVSVTTNALPYSVYGKTTKAGLFTVTAKKKAGAYNETLKFRVLVNPAPVDTAIFGDELTNIVTMAYVPFEWDLTNDVAAVGGKVAKVAGLPAGLAFASATTYKDKKKTQVKQYGQTIVGKPTKPGTYVVTFTKNETTGTGKKKTVAKTAQILWTVVESDAELSLGFNEKGGVIESGTVGLSYGDLMAFDATDGAKVTASGLPAGIKLADLGGGEYAFKGFTAKAGTYLVTVTATLNGKTVRQRIALKVDGLPSWAKGTYNGVVYATSGDLDYAGYGTVSVSSAGKISGKFSENGTNWTFSASSYDFYTDEGGYDGDTEIFQCTNVVAKYAYNVTEKDKKGKKKTVTKYLTRNYTLSAGNLEVSPGVMRGTVVVTSNGDDGLVAYQNLWGQSGYKALGNKLFYTSKKVPYKNWSDVDAKGLTDAMSLSVKVTPAGELTATMTFDTGKTTKDKKTNKKTKVYYKATASTVLIPLSAADADPFSAAALLYFAPSAANNFPGLCTEIKYPFAKRVAPQPGMANNWYTGEFNGYGDAQFPVDGGDTEFLNGLVSINVAANLSFTGTFAATDGTTASFSGTFVKDGDMYAANGVAITVRGQAMTMRLGCAAQPYADKDAGFGEMWGGSDVEPGEPCIALNCLWQNIWKRSDLAAEWKPAFASGTEKTLDMSEIWLDGKVDSDTLTYAFGADGAVAVSGQIYGESVSATATLDLEGYDESTNTMYCNFYFLANGHMYQQQLTFQRQASIASSDITLASFQRVD